jgi:hypothetical protein
VELLQADRVEVATVRNCWVVEKVEVTLQPPTKLATNAQGAKAEAKEIIVVLVVEKGVDSHSR